VYRHGDELTGCQLCTPIPVTEDSAGNNISKGQVEETIPATQRPLQDKCCAYLDAAESCKCIATGQIGKSIVGKPTPEQVDSQKIEAGEDGFNAIQHEVAHKFTCILVVKARWTVNTA
jgi:hypothetical protein